MLLVTLIITGALIANRATTASVTDAVGESKIRKYKNYKLKKKKNHINEISIHPYIPPNYSLCCDIRLRWRFYDIMIQTGS